MSTTMKKTTMAAAAIAALLTTACVTNDRTTNALVCGAGGAVAGALVDRMLFGGTGIIGAVAGGVGGGALCAYMTTAEAKAADATLKSAAPKGEPVSWKLAAADNQGKDAVVTSTPKGPVFVADDGRTCRNWTVVVERQGEAKREEDRRMCRGESNADWQVASAG